MLSVLVAIDFSESTHAIVEAAKQVTTDKAGQIVLLHVTAPDPEFVSYKPGPQHERDWRAEDIKKEREQIDQLRDELQGQQIKVKSLVVEGPTTDKIMEEVERFSADMIVMGTHGHTAVYEALVGSVTHAVLRRATVPVLLVPVRN